MSQSSADYDLKAGHELLQRAAAGESVEIGPRQAAALLAERIRLRSILTGSVAETVDAREFGVGGSAKAADHAGSNPAAPFGHVFMHRRPTDKQAWPVLYQDRELAERCEFRVSDIVPVELPEEYPKSSL